MPGGGTQQSKETTNETREPWAPAMPMLNQVLSDSKSLYDQGFGSTAYSGQRFAGLGADSTAGLQMLKDVANPSAATNAGSNYITSLLQNGGMNQNLTDAIGDLNRVGGASTGGLQGQLSAYGPGSAVSQLAGGLMNGQGAVNTEGDLRSLLSRALATSSAETNLGDVASGKYLDPNNANPYLDKLIQQGQQSGASAVKDAYAASGRYGSGRFAGALANSADQIETATRADQYDKERARQVEATGAIDAARATGTQLGQGIVGDIGNVQNTNNQLKLAGAGLQQQQDAAKTGLLGQILAGDQFNSNLGLQIAGARAGIGGQAQGAAQSATGLLPTLEQLRQNPGQTMLGVGATLDANKQAYYDSLRSQWDEYQQDPFQRLSTYAAFPTAIGAMGGQSTKVTTKETPQPSMFQSILGGLSSGLGLLGGFMKSDERSKENIREVGKLHDGQPVYAYNYKEGGPTQIGLMAQQVKKKHPEAVAKPPGLMGLMAVDYDKATAASAKKAA